ncbi:hypothetical protein EsH8_IV_000118 [Colletotrichum jinshuiense]
MQTKVFAAAVVAFTLSSVEGAAIQPRALTINGGKIVLPTVTFEPTDFTSGAFEALQILQNNLAVTTYLVKDLTSAATGNVQDVFNQAQLVTGQVTTNVANIGNNVNTIVGTLNTLVQNVGGVVGDVVNSVVAAVPSILGLVPSVTVSSIAVPSSDVSSISVPDVSIPIPSLTVSSIVVPLPTTAPGAIPDIGAAAEDLVRLAQALARAITAQLNALQAQYNNLNIFAKALYLATLTQTQSALNNALVNLQSITSQALDSVATATSTLQGVSDRVRNAQAKLKIVLVVGVVPDVTF